MQDRGCFSDLVGHLAFEAAFRAFYVAVEPHGRKCLWLDRKSGIAGARIAPPGTLIQGVGRGQRSRRLSVFLLVEKRVAFLDLFHKGVEFLLRARIGILSAH